MIYYWDERDGVQLRGWWVADEVGGSTVWAWSVATTALPPAGGWRLIKIGLPWNWDPKVRLMKIAGAG